MPSSIMDDYEGVIGLEVHVELATQSKMFCSSPVVDSTTSPPNSAVCPVCAGMPGVLPVVNRQAVEFALRVALALECEIAPVSLFARKNYFYPDLPKGYQISQYEYPLAKHGSLLIVTPDGERLIRIHRAHLEEDTGKLTHVHQGNESYSLVDLNRAGVPLLEIVSEPDMHTAEEARAYASALRSVLRYLGVNSGDMEKGVIRFEANVSVRPRGSQELNTRVEIKNLNSFRALERSVAYEIDRQTRLATRGIRIVQETVGWDESLGVTFSQRSKEEAHDYRYFPEPDLPPLVVEPAWVEEVRAGLPELPQARLRRFISRYGMSAYDAELLVEEPALAVYYEEAAAASTLAPKVTANWILGELFSLMKTAGHSIEQSPVVPAALADLLVRLDAGQINTSTAKVVLAEMYTSGRKAREIISEGGLQQVTDREEIAAHVRQALDENPGEVASYLAGKTTVANWLFGQVMRWAGGKADPQVVRQELASQLDARRSGSLQNH